MSMNDCKISFAVLVSLLSKLPANVFIQLKRSVRVLLHFVKRLYEADNKFIFLLF